MAKNKGKRNRTRRDSAPSSTVIGVGPVSTADASEHDSEERESSPGERESSLSIEPTPSTDNVIPFPRSSQVPLEPRDSKATLIAGTGSFGVPKPPPSDEPPKAEADSALRPAAGEQERTTIPPEESTGERAVAPAGGSTAEAVEPAKAEKPADEKPAKAEKPADKEPAKADKPADKEPAKGAKAAKPTEEETRKTLRGEVVGKKDAGRGHKESLSTHLSDEAKAFFSDAAAVGAYKQTHDTFEDLAPAAEDHASEIARSKRWMTITGVLLVGVIAVVVGFAINAHMGVPETRLDVAHAPAAEPPTPAAAPTPPPAEPPPAPPPAPAAATPVAEADSAVAPTPAVVAEPTPSPAAPTAVAADAAAAAAPTPPVVEPPAPVAPAPTPAPAVAPGGQTPQQLLAAARAFRGPLAGKVAAYNAYFDAAPTDDRAMTTFAMSMAEGSHHAEAEAAANRAVTANARNGQAWFVLAYARSQLRNRDGAAEARTRCIALGGTWATECRAIH